MSGNIWMFSDKIDDEDIEILKHDFLTYYQGADYYGLGLKVFTRMAHEAGAVYKLGKRVLIRRDIFEEYLRLHQYREDTDKADDEEMQSKSRYGTLVQNLESGRMDIRLGLQEYYGELQTGQTMEVQVDGEWIPTRLEMGDGWYLVGIETDNLIGLAVRI